MKEWIVIPVHNRKALTLGCLEHLEQCGDLARCTVLVVDDGSTDGTAEAIRARFPGVKVTAGDGNLWWTGAIARGMTIAFDEGATGVTWLNDDCLPCPGTLDAMSAFGRQSPGTIVAPRCVRSDTGEHVPSAFAGRKNVDADSGVIEVDGLSGFCVRVPRPVWQVLGVPDARHFPHYYGDTSYTLQARRAGFHVALLADASAHLVHFIKRAECVSEYVRRLPPDSPRWSATFLAKRSPFRLPTLFTYLPLKYGKPAGCAAAMVRCLAWHFQWARSMLS